MQGTTEVMGTLSDGIPQIVKNNLDTPEMNETMAGLDPEFRVKKPPTLAEYKKAMRVLWTQKHQEVDRCGHKFHPTDAPRNNCDDCWMAYFQIHGEITQLCDEIFKKEGLDTLKRLKGAKYARNFIRFMAGLAQYQKEKVEQSTRAVSDSSTGTENTGTADTSGEMEDAGGGWKATGEEL